MEISLFLKNTWKLYRKHNIGMVAAATSFYTVVSVVPLAAVLLYVANQFDFFKDQMQDFQELAFSILMPRATRDFENFIESSIEGFSTRLVGVTGIFISLVIYIRIIIQITGSVQDIWGLKDSDYFKKILSSIVYSFFVLPLLFFIGSGITNFTLTNFSILRDILEVIILSLILTFIYNQFASVSLLKIYTFFISVIISFIIIIGKSYIINGLNNIFNYNEIYGSLSVLPLFLIWLNILWLLLFIGLISCKSIYEIRENQKRFSH